MVSYFCCSYINYSMIYISARSSKIFWGSQSVKARSTRTGDRVLFAKYAGSEVTLDGQEYLIMKEEDVLGVLSS
jgi:co-chaperonin GroES (HSP10)